MRNYPTQKNWSVTNVTETKKAAFRCLFLYFNVVGHT